MIQKDSFWRGIFSLERAVIKTNGIYLYLLHLTAIIVNKMKNKDKQSEVMPKAEKKYTKKELNTIQIGQIFNTRERKKRNNCKNEVISIENSAEVKIQSHIHKLINA